MFKLSNKMLGLMTCLCYEPHRKEKQGKRISYMSSCRCSWGLGNDRTKVTLLVPRNFTKQKSTCHLPSIFWNVASSSNSLQLVSEHCCMPPPSCFIFKAMASASPANQFFCWKAEHASCCRKTFFGNLAVPQLVSNYGCRSNPLQWDSLRSSSLYDGGGVVQKLKTGSTVGGYFPIWFQTGCLEFVGNRSLYCT